MVNNMLLAVVAVLIVFLAIVVSAQRPNGAPPPAVARICFNQVVAADHMKQATRQILAEGCTDPTFVSVDGGHVLGYGVKVLIGE